jgi:hypothetical protein
MRVSHRCLGHAGATKILQGRSVIVIEKCVPVGHADADRLQREFGNGVPTFFSVGVAIAGLCRPLPPISETSPAGVRPPTDPRHG